MRKLLGLLLALALALPVWPQAQPAFGWKRMGAETFSLDATEFKYLRLPTGRLRFEFQAEDAVYAGVLTPQQYAALAGKYLTLAHFSQFHCVRESIIETSAECNVSISNAVLAIRDKRGPITRVAGAYSTVKPLGGGGTLADRAGKPNKVKVTLYQWACIENCPN
ncbi:MAG: hypothetical protein ACRD72_00770 [Candidatus Angelobacter sp.]|jgi:hypothetical protein